MPKPKPSASPSTAATTGTGNRVHRLVHLEDGAQFLGHVRRAGQALGADPAAAEHAVVAAQHQHAQPGLVREAAQRGGQLAQRLRREKTATIRAGEGQDANPPAAILRLDRHRFPLGFALHWF